MEERQIASDIVKPAVETGPRYLSRYSKYVGQSKISRNSSDWKSATTDSIWSKNDHRGIV